MSAARGAEQFYTIEHHSSRSEGLEMARYLDIKAAEAWVGHPYVDLVDNAQDFESKINQLIGKVQVVCYPELTMGEVNYFGYIKDIDMYSPGSES